MADINNIGSDDMWTPVKQLFSVVDGFLTNPSSGINITTFELALTKHKQNFIALLKNPPRNAKSREEINRGVVDGVNLPNIGHTLLSKDLVSECMIISDMYELNEFIALELLCTAQQLMPQHPGLPRGLVAILLYYDSRKTLASTLKELFQARSGISWCTDAADEVTKMVSKYTTELVRDGVLDKIINLLNELDVSKEVELLSNNRALGPPKHHRQVLDFFEEIRLQLALCLYNYSAQCGLPKTTTISLIKYLARYKAADSRGGIDNVTLVLLIALLYALDVSVLQRRDDCEQLVRKLPIVSDDSFLESVLQTLETKWEHDDLRSTALFAVGLSLATLRQAPQNMHIRCIDRDEALVDQAIQGKVFEALYHKVLENDSFYQTEFFFRRIHCLLTDFIELMHSKVTELRARADETARSVQRYAQEGLDPRSDLCHDFETLLLTVGKLYSRDKLELSLCLEYWGPMEVANNYAKSSNRSVSLFKFIRLASELLPATLFVPYLKMLAGLSSCQQSARNAFNLLKHGSGVSGSNTLSWDHFFNSLAKYYTTLRQEQHPSSETVYRNRALSRNISPQEIAGLQAVLGVIRAVATYDEVARVALCEHPNWAPLHVLLGLVGCSIFIPLKTDLLYTLAALGKSRETAIQLWNNLEASQIIPTIPSTNTFVSRGIESEIDQNESRNEVYPLTQAVLDLLYSLVSTAVPKNLGAGPRKPGLDPYVTFIVKTIFLRFYHRNYKDPAEKWVIAEKSLKIIEYFIRTYDPNPIDFPSNGVLQDENSPPGYHIMLQINTESEMLRQMLHIIDEACTMLDMYAPFPGKAKLEESALYIMNIIRRSLELQHLFFDAHYAANCEILLAGINKLLLGVNPRSGNADHMLNVTKYVTYNSWLPKHALCAVRILNYVAQQPNVNAQLLGVFTQHEQLKNTIRFGFVECLESDQTYNVGECKGDAMETEEVEMNLKEAIINLLQDCLPQTAPNIAHYLLGFDITRKIRETQLQRPGVMDFPSTCTKSLVTILDNSLERKKSEALSDLRHERLIERSYALLYALCLNRDTSDVILRFLRSCNDFFGRHLQGLPFSSGKNNSRILNQMTGLLKCVAIELKVTASKNQNTQFGNLCNILLGVVHNMPPENTSMELSHFSFVGANGTSIMMDTTMAGNLHATDQSNRLLLCRLLECLDFEMQGIERPKWDYFDNNLMHQLLLSSEMNTKQGIKLINVKKLHEVLKDDLNTVQSTVAAGQRQSIMHEIEAILSFAVALNTQKNLCAATVRFMEAWGQVTEVLFSVAPEFVISKEAKQGLLLDILQTVLGKVVPAQMMSEMTNLASATVLQLLVNLRQCYSPNISDKQSSLSGYQQNNSLNLTSAYNQSQMHSTITPQKNSLSLKYILKHIADWIIISGVASQKLRINLYAALLNFMHIIKKSNKLNDAEVHDDYYVSRLDRSLQVSNVAHDPDDTDQSQMAVEVFTSFGDKLIDILCHDCTGGHDVSKMLALSCVDMLLDLDQMTCFIQFISRRGYLMHLIDSLMKADNSLCRVLDVSPDMKALYVYESKLAMLGRIGSSYLGAELLLEQRALGVLSGMKVYDMHPDFQVNNYGQQFSATSFIPPVELRYQQILFPALNLCDVVLSTLGSDNTSAVTQVMHFLLSHGDMIEIVLRAGTPFLNLGLLKELSAITGLIARTANQDISNFIEVNLNQDLGAHLYRLQKLMLTLIPRFVLSHSTLTEMFKMENLTYQATDKNKSEHIKLFLQIACNLSLYARNAIANHSADHRTTGILFSPNISESVQRNETRSGTLEISPSIGIIVSQLRQSVEYFNKEQQTFAALVRQRNSLPSLGLDDKVQIQYNSITERLADKQLELKLCHFLTEHCLYLLWAHLDFFMLRAIPVNTVNFSGNASMFSNNNSIISTPIEAGWKVTSDDISILKKHLVQVFNETFSKQLVQTCQDKDAKTDKGFVEALLRRIKRLIQFVPVN